MAGDLGAVFAEARRRGKGSVLAIGFSLSGNALLLNLGEGHDGPHPKPDCAIAVNPPVTWVAAPCFLDRPSTGPTIITSCKAC